MKGFSDLHGVELVDVEIQKTGEFGDYHDEELVDMEKELIEELRNGQPIRENHLDALGLRQQLVTYTLRIRAPQKHLGKAKARVFTRVVFPFNPSFSMVEYIGDTGRSDDGDWTQLYQVTMKH